MDSHADIWVRSGRNPRLLHEGSTENIVAELKAWVERRRAHNDTDMAAHWNMFQFLDSLQQIGDPSSKVQQGQAAKMMDRIATITATQLEHLDYTRNLNKEKDRETALADFLLASLHHRGIRWPQIPCTKGREADAGVCAFLGLLDQGFNAETELEILEDRHRVTHWQKELRMRDDVYAHEVAKNPIPGVNTHPIGLVGARIRQAIANDSSISTMQALADAADGILDPDLLGSLLNRNPAGNTSARNNTGEATHATGKVNLLPNSTAAYTTDVLGDTNMTAGKRKSTTKDSIVYVADALGNIKVTTSLPAKVTVDPANNADNAAISSCRTPDSTNNLTGLSSSTATDTDANDKSGLGQMSKAKKKREGRKRAKVQAKESAEKTGDFIGSHDDDDKEAQALVDG